MKLLLLATCTLTLMVGACASTAEPRRTPIVVGRYGLVSVDDTQATAGGEELELRGDSTYAWRTYQVFPDYLATQVTLAEFSSGRWEVGEARLMLTDSAGIRSLGAITGDSIAIQVAGHGYAFVRKLPASVEGAYVLTHYDGYELPFTTEDSSGATQTVQVGELQLASYSTYALDLLLSSVDRSGYSSGGWARLSSGPYHWDGVTLMLQNSVGGVLATGEWIVDGVVMRVRGLGHEYEFVYSTQLPHY